MGSILENNTAGDDAVCTLEYGVHGRRFVYIPRESDHRERESDTVRTYECIDLGIFHHYIAVPWVCVLGTGKSGSRNDIYEVGGDQDGESNECPETAAYALRFIWTW